MNHEEREAHEEKTPIVCLRVLRARSPCEAFDFVFGETRT